MEAFEWLFFFALRVSDRTVNDVSIMSQPSEVATSFCFNFCD